MLHSVTKAPQHQTLSVRLRFQSLIVSLVMSRLDYGNPALAGLPSSQLRRFQLVLGAAARLMRCSSRYEHVTPILRYLHWPPFPERIDLKLAVLVYRCLHGLALWYLSDSFQMVAVTDVVIVAATYMGFRSLVAAFGTVYHAM